MNINYLKKLLEKKFFRDTLKTTGWSTLGKAVGFVIPFFIAGWFGISQKTDVLFFIYGLILFLSGIFAHVLESILVPFITEAKVKKREIGSFVGNLLGTTMLGQIIFIGLILLVIKPILKLITNFNTEAINLSYLLLLETIPLIMLIVGSSILSGTLNAYKKFTLPAISPAFRAIINLSIIFLLKGSLGIHAIAWGYVMGELGRFCILLFSLKSMKLINIKLAFHFHSRISEFFKIASFQIIGTVVIGFKPIVDKTMASWLEKGSISLLHYADRLYVIPITFISAGIMVTLLTYWSERYYELAFMDIYKNYNKMLRIMIFFGLLITLILVIAGGRMVNLVYHHGKINQQDLFPILTLFQIYMIGFPFSMAEICLTRMLLTIKNTKELMRMAFFNLFLIILFNYIFMNWLGVYGIAFSSSLVRLLGFLVFNQRFKHFCTQKTC